NLPTFPADEKGVATRSANGKVMNAIAGEIPWLIGGSADLAPSTKTLIDGAASFAKDEQGGRNLHFGVREHAMGAIVNGMTLSKLKAYGSTFLVFSDYMRPSIRLASLMKIPAIFIFTHDSIGVGEDGPTHQPVEHIASLRAMPNIEVIRPADANECSVLWKYILKVTDRPVTLALSRQNLPTLDREKYASAEGALKGGYVLADSNGQPDVIIMGTGSEIQLCITAYEKLHSEGIDARVVSMPCWTLFDAQSEDYKESVLPQAVTARIAVEAGATMGWSEYTGSRDAVLGIDDFGTSAPIKDAMQEYGFHVDAVVDAAKKRI
ncbi:transketolase, partial [candidate division KSB1 bacterium]|nr:transketolase [candidate division KSB1 bacterium]